MPVSAALGFAIGASTYQEMLLTFSPTAMTFWGSNVNYWPATMVNAAEIAALWERVKIDKVELSFSTDVTAHALVNATAAAPTYSPLTVLIVNDVNGPTTGGGNTIDQILQNTTAKEYKLGADMPIAKWTVRPKYQRLIQYTSINSANEPATGFVESGVDIPHYGVRVGILDASRVGGCHLIVTAKMYFHCKNLK